jgi:hypothetical protein
MTLLQDDPNMAPSPSGAGPYTLLTMALPKRRICLSLKNQQGRHASINMNIDTLVIEPDQRRLCMVWRRLLPFSADIATATATMQESDKSPVKESAT